MKKFITDLLFVCIALCGLNGCSNVDNLDNLFTEHAWKLSFIGMEGQYQQYNFWNGEMNAKNIPFVNSMNALKKNGFFYIQFSGDITESSINGTFTGKGINSSLSGKWTANGETRTMTSSNVKVSSSESDVLAIAFIRALQNMTRYEGDTNNLFIYYKDTDSSIKFLGLVPTDK